MKEVTVYVPESAYLVQIGSGILAGLPESLRIHCQAAAYALITDTKVAPLYASAVRSAVECVAPCHVFSFPAGETQKTRQTWSDLTDAMLREGIGRDGAVIALGGGVVGDVAGFVAATYARGIRLVHVPTTLLAMVDSSIGGKTGVDTPAGKNLVGAFHQPSLVVADVTTLETLPERELIAGIAETLKHGAIADAGYFEWVQQQRDRLRARAPDALTHLVHRSVEIKAAVVMEDEKEAGRRSTLNFGHTIAHGVEAATGYGVLHGEAVSIGMVAEARAGESLGITDPGTTSAIEDSARAFGLPTRVPAKCPAGAVVDAARTDKKNRGGSIQFAPIRRIGESAQTETGKWTFEVRSETLLEVLTPPTA